LFDVFRGELRVPRYPKVVTVQIGTTDLRSEWDFSLLWEDDTINIVAEQVVLSLLPKSGSHFLVRDAFQLADVGWMQTRISRNYDVALNVLLFGLQRHVIKDSTVELPFL
jgi:hypothetical protein